MGSDDLLAFSCSMDAGLVCIYDDGGIGLKIFT